MTILETEGLDKSYGLVHAVTGETKSECSIFSLRRDRRIMRYSLKIQI